MSYTPGPWELTSIPFRVAGDRSDLTSRFIADCNENLGDASENKANARLIAAAPDLLEALGRLINHGHSSDCLRLNFANADCDCGLDEAIKTLSKVKEAA